MRQLIRRFASWVLQADLAKFAADKMASDAVIAGLIRQRATTNGELSILRLGLDRTSLELKDAYDAQAQVSEGLAKAKVIVASAYLQLDLTKDELASTQTKLRDTEKKLEVSVREGAILLDVLKLKVYASVAEETRIKESRPSRVRRRLVHICGVCQKELLPGALRTHEGKWRCDEHKQKV